MTESTGEFLPHPFVPEPIPQVPAPKKPSLVKKIGTLIGLTNSHTLDEVALMEERRQMETREYDDSMPPDPYQESGDFPNQTGNNPTPSK